MAELTKYFRNFISKQLLIILGVIFSIISIILVILSLLWGLKIYSLSLLFPFLIFILLTYLWCISIILTGIFIFRYIMAYTKKDIVNYKKVIISSSAIVGYLFYFIISSIVLTSNEYINFFNNFMNSYS